jgi:hypothetical protein
MTPEKIYIVKKENGFMVRGEFTDIKIPGREIIVEGSDPKKIGAAVLVMFKAPRKPRVKKEA